MNKIEIE